MRSSSGSCPSSPALSRHLAGTALALLLAGCSHEDPGDAVRRKLAPTDAALRSLQPVEGATRCAPGNGLESAPLCWTADLTEPVLAGRLASALTAAGASDLAPRCAAINAQIRCEVAGSWKGNLLDISVVHQGKLIEVIGYGSVKGVPHLIDGHSPVPVPS